MQPGPTYFFTPRERFNPREFWNAHFDVVRALKYRKAGFRTVLIVFFALEAICVLPIVAAGYYIFLQRIPYKFGDITFTAESIRYVIASVLLFALGTSLLIPFFRLLFEGVSSCHFCLSFRDLR